MVMSSPSVCDIVPNTGQEVLISQETEIATGASNCTPISLEGVTRGTQAQWQRGANRSYWVADTMTIEPSSPGSAEASVFDSCARLASGLAHEFGGLLFALRMRIETLEATAPAEARRDVAALAAGLRELQATVDTIRLLGARAGGGRIVRERAVDAPLWLERTVRLARHVVPRGVVVTGTAPPPAELDGIDVGRLTAA